MFCYAEDIASVVAFRGYKKIAAPYSIRGVAKLSGARL